jgi:hypothetical protein
MHDAAAAAVVGSNLHDVVSLHDTGQLELLEQVPVIVDLQTLQPFT